MKLSVVLPCRNEEKTIAECIKAIKGVTKENETEILVVDNASTDNSSEIALSCGARVAREEKSGYGNALRKGLKEAKGETIFFADSDLTYDFKEIPAFLELLGKGNDFVIGSRFKGKMHGNAMPWLHRYIGSPLINFLLFLLHGVRVSDSQCGMRALTKKALKEMNLSCEGMEFASEMLIEAKRKGLRLAEKPIDYFPRKTPSKLNSFRDGSRHIFFIFKKLVG